MLEDEDFIHITPKQASCAIAALFYETLIPCPCEEDAVIIEGVTLSGKIARIRIKGEDIRFYGSEEDTERLLRGKCHIAAWGRPRENGGNTSGGGT